MRCIVTGGCGFIGSSLVEALVKQGNNEVFVIDNLSTGCRENVISGAEYSFNPVESGLPPLLGILSGPIDVIFHVAAVPRVSYSLEKPYETSSANLMSTLTVLEQVRKRAPQKRPRIVYSSSSSIYGGADQLPTSENHRAFPRSPYALQKWQGEEWCRMYSEMYGLDTVCLRYFNVFGPRSRFGGAYSTVISAWLYHLCVDPSYKPYLEGDGGQTRDFCYIDNVVEANLLAARHKGPFAGQAFNIAHGQSQSLYRCYGILQDVVGREFELERRPVREGDVRHTFANIREASIVLGYTPAIGFDAQLLKMAEWYRDVYAKECAVKNED